MAVMITVMNADLLQRDTLPLVVATLGLGQIGSLLVKLPFHPPHCAVGDPLLDLLEISLGLFELPASFLDCCFGSYLGLLRPTPSLLSSCAGLSRLAGSLLGTGTGS